MALLEQVSLRALLLFTSALVLLCGLVLTISMRGSIESVIQFEDSAQPMLAADADIGGWIRYDKDSYFLGERANAHVRILYREDLISPDFDAFKRNLGFLPFDLLEMNEHQSDTGSGIKEFTIDYSLQIVGIRKPGSYPLNAAVLSYSKSREPGSNLNTLRISRPPIYVGSLYPWNAGTIPLREIRERVLNQNPLRQLVMLVGGILLLLATAFICWRFGRRRTRTELTEAELLWHQFRGLDRDRMEPRVYLLACERIFSRLLQLQTSMTPDMFWSGAIHDDAGWHVTVDTARKILRRVYQSGEMLAEDVEQMQTLLSGKLALAVEQHRLELELQPGFKARIMKQPPVAWSVAIIFGISISMIILAAWPDLWLAQEIKRYNGTLADIRTADGYDEDLLLELQAFAGLAEVSKIRAAVLYNLATVRARHSFGDMPAGAQLKIRDLLFQAESADSFMQTMLLAELAPSEEDLVTLLVTAAERLLQSELDLQAAARIIENDEDILRNLELVTRWRHAILTRLVQLRELFTMNPSSVSDEDIISDQGLVNIIDAKLPEEYEDAETAKDNSSYIIFERF